MQTHHKTRIQYILNGGSKDVLSPPFESTRTKIVKFGYLKFGRDYKFKVLRYIQGDYSSSDVQVCIKTFTCAIPKMQSKTKIVKVV